MIKSGDVDFSASSANKVRYDLKQVAQWDRQIKSDQEKKLKNKSQKSSNEKKPKDQESNNANVAAYRDRANERRKEEQIQHPPQEQQSTEKFDFTSALSVEQSKFLGGDIEHTHLVKGLDFALLARIREETKTNLEILEGVVKHEKQENINTTTKLGFNLKRFLDSSGFNLIGSSKSGLKSKVKSENTLSRTVYQYDVAPRSLQLIPLTVCHSKQESIFQEEYIHFSLKSEVIQSIAALYDVETEKLIPYSKKKQQSTFLKITKEPTKTDNKGIKNSSKVDVDSIYGDDILTPSAVQPTKDFSEKKRKFPLNTIVIFTDEENHSTVTGNIKVKGLFDNFSLTANPGNKSTRSDLVQSAPLSGGFVTSHAKSTVAHENVAIFSISKALSDVIAPEKSRKDKIQIINRDVFATTVDKVVSAEEDVGKKKGDVFGTSGIYDVFPETGDYEVGNS